MEQQSPSRTRASVTQTYAAAEAARSAAPAGVRPLPDWLGTLFVALSVLIMAYSAQLNVVPILVFFALWLPLPLLRGMALLRPGIEMFWLALLPLLALASTLWSDYPATTLYLATASIAMMVCIVIMQRVTTFHAWLNGLVLGITLVLVIALSTNHYAVQPDTYQRVLVGRLGSKNMVGFFAELGVIVSLVFLLLGKGSWWRRLFYALLPLGLSTVCLSLSHSATALATLAVALVALAWALVLKCVARENRGFYMALTACALVVAGVAFAMAGGKQTVLSLLGRDVTLTGRTYLWQEGMKIAAERPLLGHGYAAFWVKGQPLAERYWNEFYIAERAGFHFHSCWVQIGVDLGVVGLLVVAGVMLATLIYALRALVRSDGSAEGVLLFTLAVMYVAREWVEVDILGPFGIGAMLYYSLIPRAKAACAAAATNGAMPSAVRQSLRALH